MKISGRVVSKRPISLNRAAKLISRFAAVENGSSPAVSLYLQRSAYAFNHLVQFHSKHRNLNEKDSENAATESQTKMDKKKKKRKSDKEERNSSDSKKARVESLDS